MSDNEPTHPALPFPGARDGIELCHLRAFVAVAEELERLTLSADATGASIALSLLLTLKAQQEPLPGKLVLFCPWVDLQLAREDPAATRRCSISTPPVAARPCI